MKSRFPLIAASAIGIGAALAFAIPAGAAVSVQSESPSVATITLGNKATLDADGAVVFAPVKFACTPGSYTSLTVSVTQNVGGRIASGSTYEEIEPCTGKEQSRRLAVTPTQRPFRKGVAFGQSRLQVCGPAARCKTVRDEHNIQIVAR